MSIRRWIDVPPRVSPRVTDTGGSGADGGPVGRVEAVIGPTEIMGADGSRRAAAPGDPLRADETVATAVDGSAVITLADGSRLALAPDTRLGPSGLLAAATTGDAAARLALINGTIAVRNGAGGAGSASALVIDSPFGEVALHGGPIVVWCDGIEAVLRVASPSGSSPWSGAVTVRTAGGSSDISAPGRLVIVVGVGAAPLPAEGDPGAFETEAVARLLAWVAGDEADAGSAATDIALAAAGDGAETVVGAEAGFEGPVIVAADPLRFTAPPVRPLPEPFALDEVPIDAARWSADTSGFLAPEPGTVPIVNLAAAGEPQFLTRPIALSRINVSESSWSEVGGWRGLVAEGVEDAVEFYRGAAIHVERGFSNPKPWFTAPPRADGRADDGMMLVISAGSSAPPGLEGFFRGATVAELEAFLGLPAGKLAAREPSQLFGSGDAEHPVSGAAIKTSVTLGKGEFLVFDALFDPPDGETFNDFAFLMVGDRVFTIASREATEGGASGWRTIAYGHQGDGAAAVTVGIGVVDDRRADIHPYLLIDNVRRVALDAQRLIEDADPRYRVLDHQAGSTLLVLAERPTVIADTVSVDEDASIAIGASVLLANDRAALPPLVNGVPMSALAVAAVDGPHTIGRVGLQNGIVTYEAAGRFQSLAEGDRAQDAFRYQVVDASGGKAWGEVVVTIEGRNDAPVAGHGSAVVVAGSRLDIPFAASDVDDALATLRVVSASAASGAVLTFGGPGGSIAYDTAGLSAWIALGAGAQARDVITYAITDPNGAVAIGSIDVDIVGSNDRPVARDTLFGGVSEDTGDVRIDLLDPGISMDPDLGDVLSLLAVDQVAGPPLAFRLDGGSLVIDQAGFQSLASGSTEIYAFAFTVGDGHGVEGTDPATLTLVVDGHNDAPVAAADVVVVAENDFATADVFRDNGAGPDADVDRGDSLHITAVNGAAADVGRPVGLPAGGVVTLGADGRFAYESGPAHDALRDGEVLEEVFTYTVTDDHGAADTAVVRVRITGVNDAPTAAADEAVTDADAAVRIAVLANDRDPDVGDRLTINRIADIPVTFAGTAVSLESGATVRLNPDGSLTYDPASTFAGLAAGQVVADAFNYGVRDGSGALASATVTIGVRGVTDPEAGSTLVESFEVLDAETGWPGNWTRSGDIRRTLPEDMPVRVVGSYQAGSSTLAASHLDHALLISSAVAPADPLTLAADIEAALGLQSADIGRAVGRAPNSGAAAATSVWMQTGQTLSFAFGFVSGERGSDVASNDFAVFSVSGDSAAQVFKLADVSRVHELTGSVEGAIGPFTAVYRHDGPAGRYTIGLAVFNHASDFNTSLILADNLRFDANVRGYRPDGERFQIVATPPRPADDVLTTGEDATRVVPISDLLANDRPSSAGGAVSVVDVGSIAAAGAGSVTLPSGARLVVADGAITYDPRGAFDFLAAGAVGHDLFDYTVTGDNGAIAGAAVRVDIRGDNDPPDVATALSVAVNEGAPPFTVDLLAGAVDPDRGDTLHVEAFVQAAGPPLPAGARAGGALTIDPAAYRFLAPGENLTLEFRYVIADGSGKTHPADIARVDQTLTITVEGTNHPPQPADDAFAIDADTVFSGNVIIGVGGGADVDADGDALAIVAFDATSALGVPVVMNADGDFAYDPRSTAAIRALAAGASAVDRIDYAVADRHGGVGHAGIDVTLRGVNDAPVTADDGLATDARTPLAFTLETLLVNDGDVDSGDIAVVADVAGLSMTSGGEIRLPSGAVLRLDAHGIAVYDPDGAFDGLRRGETVVDGFDYTVVDTFGATSRAHVHVTVSGLGQSRLVDGFEGGLGAWVTRGAVSATSSYAENDAIPAALNRTFASPDGSDRFAVIGADDPAAASVRHLRDFLGLTDADLAPFRDADFSQAINGAAMRLTAPLSLVADDVVSFAFAFDNRDFANLGRNDYAIVVIGGEAHRLIDGRAVDVATTQHRLSSEWRVFEWRAPADGVYDIAFAVFDDNPDIDAPGGDPAQRPTDSRLLVDAVWVNAPPVDSGYSVTSTGDAGGEDPVAAAAAG